MRIQFIHLRTRLLAPMVILVAMNGCASLDPTGDIQRASDLVTTRSTIETGWSSPWSDPSPHWDGESPLSADDAVRVALQNNRAIRGEVESIVASRADVVQAHLLPNPVINAAFGFPTDGLGGNPLSANLVQQLAWLWKRPHMIEGAEAALQARILAVSNAAIELVANVRVEHARVVHQQHAVDLQQDNVRLLSQSTRLLENQAAVGEASQLDLNRVELERRTAEVVLTSRRAALAESRRRLLELLARADRPADWDVVGDRTVSPTDTPDEARIIEMARSQRLDVAAAFAVLDRRRAAVSLEESAQTPEVSAGAGYQRNFADRPGVFPSVSITPRLFDDNSARIARAMSELRQAEIEADRIQQNAVAQARIAWVNLRAQEEIAISYQDEIVALAESSFQLAQDAFNAGETDLNVLLEAQRQLNTARIELADRAMAAARHRIELERAVGGAIDPHTTVAAGDAVPHVEEVTP